MLVLVTAVVTASLLGSMHCVGMCGPLAIWASGAGESASRRRIVWSTSLYHFGRLTTYVIAGLIAGGIGSLVDIGGQTFGFQLAAARVVGMLMVLIGAWRLMGLAWAMRGAGRMASAPSRVGGLLVKLRPYVFQLPASARALAVGMLTTLLPCGWLYLFALIAAGTGSVLMGGVTMAAFWVGTVPALTALIAGTQTLSREFVKVVPVVTAILLIVAGGFTATGRGFAGLNSMSDLGGGGSLDLMGDRNGQIPTEFCNGGVGQREPGSLPFAVDQRSAPPAGTSTSD
ncbi:sulfite exporter TauE/SafE family protein [Allorhodopirellula heiligendammensis]|uniref:Urease accessory protein UreH-like transmembrane domain-containing protein n=1 Tax=Allorhodopirellula heiligendammensis TaxID=2714739 RepID=A0A5C6BDC9_9BACT|nr:sulfite exporter TauE/SafE family protein [Allorhodopirellula heiligendammensis]TWU10113.1 hypothetical protein Poly21_50820 [Allorhodopirellula heiligendammensis]